MTSPSPKSQCRLILIDLQAADQFSELQKQRVVCGWDYDPQTIQKWADKQQERLKSFFWITIPSNPDSKKDDDQTMIRVGHISLSAACDPPDPERARADKSILNMGSFFILPEYRAYGLGRRVMELIEETAVTELYGSPDCRFLTLTALSKRHMYDEGPEWRGIWERLGLEEPSFSLQEWYEKLGYVGWKEGVLYEEKGLDGDLVKLWDVFMKKELRSNSGSQID